MTQIINIGFNADIVSNDLNLRQFDAVGNCVIRGFTVIPGSSGLSISISRNGNSSSLLYLNGIRIEETTDLANILALDTIPTGGNSRIDTVACKYTWGTVGAVATYEVIKGASAVSPNRVDMTQVQYANYIRLADIFVTTGDVTVLSERITNIDYGSPFATKLDILTSAGILKANSYFSVDKLRFKEAPYLSFSAAIDGTITTAIAEATITVPGLFSAADKVKLNGVETGATNYQHPANHSPSIITQDSNNRFFTDTERTKLAGIAAGATNYTHPSNHPASIITQDASNRFVTDTEKTTWDAKASTDAVTTSVNGLMIATDKALLDKTRMNGSRWEYFNGTSWIDPLKYV